MIRITTRRLLQTLATASERCSRPAARPSAQALAQAFLLALSALALGLGWWLPTPAQAAPASAEAGEPYSAASSPYSHRPLRSNQAPAALAPTEPETFAGYPEAPPFTVLPRQQLLTLYPCSQCHKVLPLNTQPRKLVNAPHPAALQHGKGRIWCLDCHQGNDRDALHTTAGAKVDFNQSYLVCGQCHSARQRDWYFGAHGKRAANWNGERQLFSCTHCHDPHNPTTATRLPRQAPPLRAGLTPMQGLRTEVGLPWQHPTKGGPDGQAAPNRQP